MPNLQKYIFAFILLSFNFSFAEQRYCLEQILVGTVQSDPQVGDNFGNALAFNGPLLTVTAATAEPQNIFDAGVIYFFKKKNCDACVPYRVNQPYYTNLVAEEGFGGLSSAASGGDWLFVGIDGTANYGLLSADYPGGAVFVFKLNTNEKWELWQVLAPSDLQLGDAFGGTQLALDAKNGWSFVGAIGQKQLNSQNVLQTFAGAVYVFRLNPHTKFWEQTQKILKPEEPVSRDRFGICQAVHGRNAMIGNEGNENAPVNGAVYVYRLNGGQWENTQKLVGAQTMEETLQYGLGDNFGFSLDFDKDWAIISSLAASTPSVRAAGNVSFFKATTDNNGEKHWTLKDTLFSDDPTYPGYVGTKVLIRGSTAYAGQLNRSTDRLYAGSVLVFQKEKRWRQDDVIFNPTHQAYDFFGFTFDVEGDQIAIGDDPFFDIRSIPGGRDFNDPNVKANNGKVAIFRKR